MTHVDEEASPFGGAEALRFLRGGMVLWELWRFYGAPELREQ